MSFRRPCGRFFIAYTNLELFSKAGQLFCFGNRVTDLSPYKDLSPCFYYTPKCLYNQAQADIIFCVYRHYNNSRRKEVF